MHNMPHPEMNNENIVGLKEAFEVLETPEALQQDCQDAAARGWHMREPLRKLRDARRETGFLAVSFKEYLEVLSSKAGIDLAPIFRSLRIDSLTTAEAGWQAARLAEGIGLPPRELLAQLGIGVAEHFGVPLSTVALCRTRNGGPRLDVLGACETVLADLLRNPEVADTLRAVQDGAAARYDQR